jgi:hypothetical protein
LPLPISGCSSEPPRRFQARLSATSVDRLLATSRDQVSSPGRAWPSSFRGGLPVRSLHPHGTGCANRHRRAATGDSSTSALCFKWRCSWYVSIPVPMRLPSASRPEQPAAAAANRAIGTSVCARSADPLLLVPHVGNGWSAALHRHEHGRHGSAVTGYHRQPNRRLCRAATRQSIVERHENLSCF